MKVRLNPIGIQMISDVLHKRIYGLRTPKPKPSANVESILQQLKKSIENIEFKNDSTSLSSGQSYPWEGFLKYLPPLKNDDVIEHVQELGKHFSLPYLRKVYELLQIREDHFSNPPKEWVYKSGWTRYTRQEDGSFKAQSVSHPLEKAIVFDVEICMEERNKNKPTLAVALTPEAWYSWTSDVLVNFCDSNNAFGVVDDAQLGHMIPMGYDAEQERLIVGHNVSFDRSYIKEQYHIDNDKARFLDTMSLHIAVSGLNQDQKMFAVRNGNPWKEVSSLNNMNDVYKLYCKAAVDVNKDPRNIFVKGTMKDVQDNFQMLTSYCANDVAVTLKILRSLFPLFVERFPSPVTFFGMLEMSVMYLPANRQTWRRYIDESQSIYEEYKNEINHTLQEIACESCTYLENNRYKRDPWLWDLDWSTKEIGFKKAAFEQNTKKITRKTKAASTGEVHFSETDKFLKKVQPIHPGYPQWFLEFCDGKKSLLKRSNSVQTGDQLPSTNLLSPTSLDFETIMDSSQLSISPKLRCIPKLLKLTWKGFPLHYDKTYGWGYLVPDQAQALSHDSIDQIEFEPLEEMQRVIQATEADLKQLIASDAVKDIVPGCLFFKLPHKDGPSRRVGNPLGKDFLKKISDGTLRPFLREVNELVQQQNKISYWTNSSKRIVSQMHMAYNGVGGEGAILPRVVVSGTVTRRAVEPTWLTASNSYPDRLGSELKGIIQCPPNYSYVGADVDSQELWIASLIGDAHYSGIQGSTGLGWMTLRGERSLGTDMHSVTANAINITRDEAKVLNYARIYGSGQDFAGRFLRQSNPNLTEDQAKEKAKKMFAQTKGTKRKFTTVDEDGLKVTRSWTGGTESHMFNQLEQIARSDAPETPFLRSRISRALEPASVGYDFMTSRVNWVVQSSAVDFLHILLTTMKWLIEHLEIDGRFSISIHDEIRYIVRNEHIYKTALALQLSNLIARAYFTAALNLNDLPASVAFFSSIEIDRCLRKDVKHDCVTPSNPLGLSKGYGVPSGQSLDIHTLLKILDQQQQQTSGNNSSDDDSDGNILEFKSNSQNC